MTTTLIQTLAAVRLLPATASAREVGPSGLPRTPHQTPGRGNMLMLADSMGDMPSLVAEEAGAAPPALRIAQGRICTVLKSGSPHLPEFWLGHRLPAAPSNDRAVSLPGDGGARLSECFEMCVPGLHAQKVAMETGRDVHSEFQKSSSDDCRHC